MELFNADLIWPGWETVRKIGEGSYGAVYEIKHTYPGGEERAAMKVISLPKSSGEPGELAKEGYDEETVTSFYHARLQNILSEYTLMRNLKDCVNVVNCDDLQYIQHSDGIGWDIFIRMELLTSLTDSLGNEADVPEETVIRIGQDMCNALAVCSKEKIVHRDIKPQNMFVSDKGDYKLGDFGIARTMEKTASTATVAGTPKYMAPEVMKGEEYGAAADICSLGLVLYWLLNEKRLPFMPLPPEKITPEDDEKSIKLRRNGTRLPSPAHGSKELKAIVLKACEYDPKKRFHSAGEMLEALSELNNPGGDKKKKTKIKTKKDKKALSPEKKSRRKKITAAVAAVLAVLVAVKLLYVPQPEWKVSDGELYSYSRRYPSEIELPLQDGIRTAYVVRSSLFYNHDEVKSVIIPEGYTEIEDNVFYNCSRLKSVSVPSSVATIGKSCFSGCEKLTALNLPENLKEINENLFYKCSSLKEITIPSGVESIGKYAFNGCESLESIELPENLESIGERAFDGCQSLTEIKVSCTAGTECGLGDYCFSNCTGLCTAVLGEGVVNLPDYAFYKCSSLKEIWLPSTLKYAGTYAFLGCEDVLQTVHFGGTQEQWDSLCINMHEGCKVICSGSEADEKQEEQDVQPDNQTTAVEETASSIDDIQNTNTKTPEESLAEAAPSARDLDALNTKITYPDKSEYLDTYVYATIQPSDGKTAVYVYYTCSSDESVNTLKRGEKVKVIAKNSQYSRCCIIVDSTQKAYWINEKFVCAD